MARPLRIEYAGALYHVTSRGDGQEDIYLDDNDREIYLEVLAEARHRFNWAIHAYCLMSNHYHLGDSGDSLLKPMFGLPVR